MPYITVRQPQKFHQMTFEEFLSGEETDLAPIAYNEANTATYFAKSVPRKYSDRVSAVALYRKLKDFNRNNAALFEKDRDELYSTFYTEKHDKGMPLVFKRVFESQGRFVECSTGRVCGVIASCVRPVLSRHSQKDHDRIVSEAETELRARLAPDGFDGSKICLSPILKEAYRKIDAPEPSLMNALRELKRILEQDFGALYHTSAFAYVPHRSTVDAVKRHQFNKSRWFGKYDLSDFFGSTTQEFLMDMLSDIFPFSMLMGAPAGKDALSKALSLAFLRGGLPQGTPVSPTLTNIMMIPIDFKLCNTLRNFEKQTYVYTRYADDFLISSRYDFDPAKIAALIKAVLGEFGAPFRLNEAKTRYGSSAGSNWNLGVMLNKDNEITVGYKNKRRFQAQLTSYVLDTVSGKPWNKGEVQALEGYRNYYSMVEKQAVENIVQKINVKYAVDVAAMIKADLRA